MTYAPTSVLVLDDHLGHGHQHREVRVDFDGPLVRNIALEEAANYSFTTATAGGVDLSILKIIVPDVDEPDFLIFIVSEMTTSASYDFAVLGNVDGQDGDAVSSTPVSFTGSGTQHAQPELVLATGKNRVRVQFNEQMKITGDLANPAAYTFDNGLTVSSVDKVDQTYVELITSDQDSETLYTATLTGVFKDLANNAMASPFNTLMLGYQEAPDASALLKQRVYGFIIESIRDEDQRRGKQFLERYLEGPQEVWKQIFTKFFEIGSCWSSEDAPSLVVPHLKNIVGWTKSLEPITDRLDESTLRRLIADSSQFWKERGPEAAIASILRLTTGARLRILNWFDFRWISDETELNWDWGAYDSWVVSDPSSRARPRAEIDTGATFSDSQRCQGLAIPAGDYESLVVIVAINSEFTELRTPRYTESGVERELQFLGVVESSGSNSVGQMALSAWVLNGVSGAGGALDVFPAALRTKAGGSGLPSLNVSVKAVRNLDRIRNLLFSRNSSETSSSSIAGGARAIQDGDLGLAFSLTTPRVTVEASENLGLDSQIGYGEASLDIGSFLNYKDGVEYQFDFSPNTDLALVGALSLTGRPSKTPISGDENVYQIRIVDNGKLDKQLVRLIAALTRPSGERVDILYLGFLDLFLSDDDNTQWTDDSGSSVVSDGTFKLSDDTTAELSCVSLDQAPAWSDYVVHVKARITSDAPNASQMFIGAYWTDSDNYYWAEFELDSDAGPSEPSTATVRVRKVVGGSGSIVATTTFPDMIRGVYYTLSMEVVSNGTTNEISVLVDGNLVMKTTDNALSKGAPLVGHSVGSSIEVDGVEMMFIPGDFETVGINNKLAVHAG